MRLPTILFASLLTSLTACVGQPPDDFDTGGKADGAGEGDGDGTGSGDGSGDGTGGGSGTGGAMTATRFLDEIGKTFCAQAFMCESSFPTDAGVTFAEAFGSSEAQCASDSLMYYEPQAVEAQIQAGTIMWDATDATACLGGITAGTCDQFWQLGPTMPAACDTALVGTVADGGACVTHFECENLMSYCDEQTSQCTPEPTDEPEAP